MSETVTQVNETTQQIVRSRTCGLKDFYIALVQSNTATAYTAGTPVKLARAIKAKIDEKWTSEKIYSDDNTEEVITSYEGTDVELEINALAPQDRVILFGQLYEYEFSCGSVPNRGAHYGKKYIERWIQRDKKNCKYVLKMDIRHFFESVDHDVLKAWLKKKIRDERMLYILELIIDGSEVGLPLGFYTSQWLSNFMLQPLDHFIKEQLKAVHYIRYMDDMVVFGKNKKELHRMQQEIERFLREKFNLQMKGNWQVFRFDYTEKKTGKRKGRPLDFMGFQFYHDKTILRESIMLSCTRKVNRVAKKEKITWYDATAILSYMGYLSNTDTYDMYLQRVKPYVNVKKLKKIVSKHSKRKEREKHERMERSVRNGGRTAGGVRHNSITDNGISETQYQESNERGCRRKENHRMAARGA